MISDKITMSYQVSNQQHTFFRMLSSYPSFREAKGKLFGHYAHNRLFQLKDDLLLAYSSDGAECCISMLAQMITENTALRNI
jgi:hypothetical protein